MSEIANGRWWSLLWEPVVFFRGKRDAGLFSLRFPIYLVAILVTWSFLLQSYVQRSLFNEFTVAVQNNPYLGTPVAAQVLSGLNLGSALGLISGAFGSFYLAVRWILISFLLANFAVLAGHEFRFKELVCFTGYCSAALFPVLATATGLAALHPLRLDLASLVTSRTALDLQWAAHGIQEQVLHSPNIVVVRNLRWFFVGCSDILAGMGFKELFQVRARAAITVMATTALIVDVAPTLALMLFLHS